MEKLHPDEKYRIDLDAAPAMLKLIDAMRAKEMTYFRKLKICSGPYSVITDEEAKVLLDVALMVLNSISTPPDRGTLRIRGRRRGRELQDVLMAELHFGPSYIEKPRWKGSDWATDEAIARKINEDNELETFRGSAHHNHDNKYPFDTGYYNVYYDPPNSDYADLHVFSLITTYGQFLMAFYADVKPELCYEFNEKVLWALAQALAELRPDDTGLKKIMQKEYETLSQKWPRCAAILDTVKWLFAEDGTPAIQSWRKVQNTTRAVQEPLPLYFE